MAPSGSIKGGFPSSACAGNAHRAHRAELRKPWDGPRITGGVEQCNIVHAQAQFSAEAIERTRAPTDPREALPSRADSNQGQHSNVGQKPGLCLAGPKEQLIPSIGSKEMTAAKKARTNVIDRSPQGPSHEAMLECRCHPSHSRPRCQQPRQASNQYPYPASEGPTLPDCTCP